jgi:hypothetical protein
VGVAIEPKIKGGGLSRVEKERIRISKILGKARFEMNGK